MIALAQAATMIGRAKLMTTLRQLPLLWENPPRQYHHDIRKYRDDGNSPRSSYTRMDQAGSTPFAFRVGPAAGAVRKRISACAASRSFAEALSPAANPILV